MKTSLAFQLAALLSIATAVQAQPPLETLISGDWSGLRLEDARSHSSPASVPGVAARHAGISNPDADFSLFVNKEYQIGDEWGKKAVTPGSLARESAVFQRAAKATAHFGAGTAFYLGKFNGRHMMATNNHVMKYRLCERLTANFGLLGRRFQCEKEYGSWADIDLALFSIRVPAAEEAVLSGLGGNFAYDASIYPGQELLTVGFGVAENKERFAVANQDSDCKVFSGRDEFRFMADPDNAGSDKVWSFSNGCDVSHGDSGSAFVDRKTGEVLGLLWGGRIPKPAKVGRSAYLDELLRNQSGEIWTELSYAVPAARIRDVLSAFLAGGSRDPDKTATIKALLGRP